MTATVERIRKEASQLPFDERVALVRVLELDLDATSAAQDDPAEVEADWDAVVMTRVDEIMAGAARLIPLDEVEAEMDAFVASMARS